MRCTDCQQKYCEDCGKEITVSKPTLTIDCDASPFIPDGWSVEEHKKMGKLRIDPSKIVLYLDENQKDGKSVEGDELRNKLMEKQVLNANVLDYLLANTESIPESWKDKGVYFWGTIYRNAGGNLCVRCLFWNGGQWYWSFNWLGGDWCASNPAAMLER